MAEPAGSALTWPDFAILAASLAFLVVIGGAFSREQQRRFFQTEDLIYIHGSKWGQLWRLHRGQTQDHDRHRFMKRGRIIELQIQFIKMR